VNANQRVRILKKVERLVGGLRGKTIGILGLAFKPNTDDLREAPSIDLIRQLLDHGAAVKAFDPAAVGQVATLFPAVEMCKDAYGVAEGSDAVVLVTEWNQFRNLDLRRIRDGLRSPVFVDCRNVYDPERMAELGFIYEGVGRLPRRGREESPARSSEHGFPAGEA
jgi:UDPglucose 6-dehydrogenase